MTDRALRVRQNAVTFVLWTGLLKAGLALGAVVAVAARSLVAL